MRITRIRDQEGVVHPAVEQPDGTFAKLTGDYFAGDFSLGKPVSGHLQAPVVPPTIYCIGLNYRQHAAETGLSLPEYPVVFMKSPTAVQNPGGVIEIPLKLASYKVDYECELAVVIGQACKNVRAENALDYVLGCTCANDVSARDWQKEWGGKQWCRAKTFDTFCPLGPALVTLDELGDPCKLALSTQVNGELRQEGHTSDMIFSVPELIAFLSGSTTLQPGTVILTGTPHGVGMAMDPPRWLQPSDTVRIEIEKIGVLSNPVVNEPA